MTKYERNVFFQRRNTELKIGGLKESVHRHQQIQQNVLEIIAFALFGSLFINLLSSSVIEIIKTKNSLSFTNNYALWIIRKVYFAFTLIVPTCPPTGERQTNASSKEENSY